MAGTLARAAGIALLSSFALAGTASAQDDALSPEYLALLRRYAAGERQQAVADLAGWPDGRVRREIDALRAIGERARLCHGCADGAAWRDAPPRAGLLLHADRALAGWRAGRPARLHELAVLDYATLLRDDPEQAPFVRRFYEATAATHHVEMRWDAALSWANRGRRAFPESVALDLVVAAVEEEQGALIVPRTGSDAFRDPAGRGLRMRAIASRDARGHFEAARAALRRAAATDPACVEARLRLGHVAWRLGEREAARVELEAVLAAERQGERAFLAHLFSGRLAADAGRLEDAARCYGAALALLPRSPSAGVALSEARHRLGDLAGAREALPAGLPEAGRRRANDPFWTYPLGASIDAEARLEALRREVVP